MDNDYLKLPRSNEKIRVGIEYNSPKVNGLIVTENNVWKKLHFKSFKIPLPVHHPLFITLPYIEFDKEKTNIGFRLLDQSEKEMITFLLEDEISLKQKFADKIFNLPFFKNRYSRLDFEKIWEDLFYLEINESKYTRNFSVKKLINTPDKVIFEMLYKIYILKMRHHLFEEDLKEINFWKERNMGIVKIIDDETKKGRPEQYQQEKIFYYTNGRFFKFYIRSKLNNIAATNFREKFLNDLEFFNSEKDDAIKLYSEYNTFPYYKKIGQEGMIYLYSAWTHDMERSTFFAEMINFIERGDAGLKQVNSLYEFALKKFGSNFSSDLKKLKETQYQKLQRKISEEKEREILELKKKDNYIPEKFESKAHKIKFFLNKAKEKGINLDTSNSELIGD